MSFDCNKVKNTNWSRFCHYSPHEIKCIEKQFQGKEDDIHHKPKGIYLAPNNDWLDWCRDNDFYPHDYQYGYRITRLNDSRILCLTLEKVKEQLKPFIIPMTEPWSLMTVAINWSAVKNQYDGLYIPWELADHMAWFKLPQQLQCFFNMFDVETLVLWNNDVVEWSKMESIPSRDNE